jgi:hypothetical protein
MTPPSAVVLIAASAIIVGMLGTVHLALTFFSQRFAPRDAALRKRMDEVSPRITNGTTMWRAGQGFHASHSLGAMLFGSVYLAMAQAHAPVLMASPLLLTLGLAYLLAMTALAWRCWFRVPLAGLALASGLYALGWAMAI